MSDKESDRQRARDYMAERYRNDEDFQARARLRAKKWREENPERYRESRRRTRAKKKAGDQAEYAAWLARASQRVRKWQAKNKERSAAYAKARLESRMQLFIRIKQEQGCKTCGLTDHRCLDFHHRDPQEKSFTLSQARHKTMAVIEAEIAKCDVVCANCHRIAHWTERRG